MRLKVRLVLETTTGERIAEIDNEHVFPGSFDEPTLRTAEASLARALDATVLSPARTLIRAHVNKLLDRVSFRRRKPVPPAVTWPDDSRARAILDDKLAEIMPKTHNG